MNSAELLPYLEAGFIDYKKETDIRYLPKILTNDAARQVKVLDNLVYELEHCDDFFFSVAFVTNTGISCLADTLLTLKRKNIKGRILASQYQNFTEPRALKRLLAFPNIQLKIITADFNFHAKGYLFHTKANSADSQSTDYYKMIIGSSNLTQTALTVNREWNVELSSLKEGALIRQMQAEMEQAWQDATTVTENWIAAYEKIYAENKSELAKVKTIHLEKINPNKMQAEALLNIESLRKAGKERALLISATGTGKTYLSAFDVRSTKPNRCLFIVHRGLIARRSKESFERIIDTKKFSTGLYTSNRKDTDKDYLFATIQTLKNEENLKDFKPDTFDYIIVDEAHHAGAETYQKVLSYFKPKFLLGMTATPERTDGYDIFKDFGYNIAYEIRLNQALSENMLVPFHYHGISEITVNGEILDDHSDFAKLTCEERVKNILYYADFYGCDQGRIKGLVFCSRLDEAEVLADAFNKHGKKAATLTGATTEAERNQLIERLESDEVKPERQLDYIFSVDVLNEGVDIPAVNQVIMLRPTESAIIYVQQLGRGLRKSSNKRYLEVIDFIGNYENNYLLPVALYGDRSYNKEKIRRVMHTNYVPGASTVHFDDIIKERIFESLNRTNFTLLRTLKESYNLVKFKLGRSPMMTDFINLGDKDPYLFVQYAKSYYNFKQKVDYAPSTLSPLEKKILEFISLEIANGRRLEDIVLLGELLSKGAFTKDEFIGVMQKDYAVNTSLKTIASVINVLTLKFFKNADAEKYGNLPLVEINGSYISLTPKFRKILLNDELKAYFTDALAYGRKTFLSEYDPKKFYHGFKLYGSYTRKDVCRILNWVKDESSTMYGYRVKNNSCPMFVTYNKGENISASTRYADHFTSPQDFTWQTRNRVSLTSPEVIEIEKDSTLKLLFIKKSDAEGAEFYFMGPVTYKSSRLNSITDARGRNLPVVNIDYSMDITVDPKIYAYFEG